MSELVLETENKLPNGWILTSIGDVVSLINGRAFKPEDWSNNGLPIVRIQNLNDPDKPFNYCNFKVDKKFLIDNGQLLFAWSGTPGTSFGTFIWNGGKAVLNQHIFRVEINEKFQNKKYLLYAINQNLNKYITKAHGTAGLAHITKGMFEEGQILLPPLNEQKRIVEKIEEMLSLIDSNLETISILENKITIFKQSLLFNGFNGKLTKVWRKSNPNLISNQNIIEKLKKMNKKFIEIPKEITKHLSQIPSNWSWTYLSNLGELSRGKSKHRPRNDPKLFGGDYPFIQTGIVRNSNRKIVDYEQTYNEIGLAQSRLFPKDTLCITIAANIAETSILTFPSCFPDSIVGFIGFDKIINNMFVMYYIKSYQEKLESIAPATAQKNINLNILQNVVIPIMSYDEQIQIINKFEIGFSLADNFTHELKIQKKIHERLKRSILNQAFEGKLVPQDPNDEPAEILLHQIKQEKEQITQKQKTSRKKKNVK